MPVKATAGRHARHPGDQRELTQLQLRVGRLSAPEPRPYLLRRAGPHQRVVKRRCFAFEEQALAANSQA